MRPEPRLSRDPIPEILRSYSTQTFFDRCLECDTRLLEQEIPYFIEKSIKTYPGLRGYDVIFEYAICLKCANEIRQRLSRESMRKMAGYIAENYDPERRSSLIENFPDQPEKWMEECLIKGISGEETQEYQLYAHCIYDRLLLPEMPYMISSQAINDLADLMSSKTLGEMDDFIGKHFGPPSELESGPRNFILV
jgi:hypothetical protein